MDASSQVALGPGAARRDAFDAGIRSHGTRHDDDNALVRRVREGSRDAAAELFSRHWPGAWRAALALTRRADLAEDAAQDAFERAFAGIARFDERRPFAPWLHRIVVNRAIDLLRAERRVTGDAFVELPAPEPTGPGDRAMLDMIGGLSVERRAVVVLRYGLGYGPAAIGEILDLPVGTVHSRLARALEDLRERTERCNA